MKNTEEFIFALSLIIVVLSILVIAFSYVNEKQSKLLKQYNEIVAYKETSTIKLVKIILEQAIELENYELANNCKIYLDSNEN